uniref:MADF domain-containing protein n=1 Tax=Toxocara canis TaxID=6265 RepID=A0A183TZJ4_TOXCA
LAFTNRHRKKQGKACLGPLIWDQRLPEHGDAAKTRLAWKAIASKLGGYAPEEWRKVWKNKRDYYNCSTRKGTASTNWPYARLLTFLDPVLGHRQLQSPTNVPQTSHNPQSTSTVLQPLKEFEAIDLRPLFNRNTYIPEPSLEMLAFGKYVAVSLASLDDRAKKSAILQIHAVLMNHASSNLSKHPIHSSTAP